MKAGFRPVAVVLLAALLAACPAGAPTGPTRPGASAKPRVATSKAPSPRGSQAAEASPAGSAAPGASLAPAASIAPAAAATLAKPPAGTTALRGKVTIEAGYALTRGATLLASGAIAAAGTRLDAAGRLVSDQGGVLLSDAGASVIANNSGGFAPDLGDGTLLAGGGLIANNGGGLIANNGGGLVGDGGGYHVLQAATPQAGTELPAAGMLVSVVSLATREYLPLGQDAAGKPVYAVWSDPGGGFEVHVPDDAPANLLVVASPAGERDRRLALNVVVAGRGAEAQVDELERLVARYVRRAFAGKLVAMLRSPELATTLTAIEPSLTQRAKDDLVPFIAKITEDARAAGLAADAPEARMQAVAQRAVDLMLADVDLATLVIDAQDVNRGAATDTPKVLDAYRAVLRDVLDGSAAKLRLDPNFFTQAYLEDVINAPRDGEDTTTPIGDWSGDIRTPGDVGEFLLVEYFATVRKNFAAPFRRMMAELYGALGATELEKQAKTADVDARIYGAGQQATVAMARHYMATPALQEAARKIFAGDAASPAP